MTTATINIPTYFQRYAWSCEQVDEQIWRSTFSTERDEEFDLYVMLSEECVHFAVSPIAPKPQPECQARLHTGLLRLNQQMRLVYFAVDEEGDINLLAELPRRGFVYPQFALVLDTLLSYTQALAADLLRLATEPNFYSALIPSDER